MASIGNSLPITGSNQPSSAAASASLTTASSALGNEGTFLQLLVAQLKNQDPSQPQDGTQFVSQLATFSNLEQSIGIKSDLDTIKSKYVPTAPSTGTPAA